MIIGQQHTKVAVWVVGVVGLELCHLMHNRLPICRYVNATKLSGTLPKEWSWWTSLTSL
jgi:hypothetical protein